jgi:hypothetical protein
LHVQLSGQQGHISRSLNAVNQTVDLGRPISSAICRRIWPKIGARFIAKLPADQGWFLKRRLQAKILHDFGSAKTAQFGGLSSAEKTPD